MPQYRVIKKILNIRSTPAALAGNYVSDLPFGEVITLAGDTVAGTDPNNTGNNLWYRYNNNYIWHGGVEPLNIAAAVAVEIQTESIDIQTYEQKKAAFLADASMAFLHDNSTNEANWKISWGHVDMEIWKVWKYGYRGQRVKVAVIDDGCWYQQNDMYGRIGGMSWNLLGNNNDVATGNCSHGTLSAGLIGASGKFTALGIAPDCELTILKAGDAFTFQPIQVYNALRYIYDKLDVDIISLSFSGSYNSHIEKAINDCLSKGIIIIAAAGTPNNMFKYPASYNGVFSVGAYILKAGQRANYIEKTNPYASVTFTTPGDGLLSAGQGKERAYHTETSASAAFASGIAALGLCVCKDRNIPASVLVNALRNKNNFSLTSTHSNQTAYEGYGAINTLSLMTDITKQKFI